MQQGLVVDESPIVRQTLAIMLAHLGFAVSGAESAAAALALCQEQQPDLVLIDWSLPDDDGIGLLGQLRRLPGGERMKLILCPLGRSVAQIEAALAAGADEYITKPFGFDVLETKLGYLGLAAAAPAPADPVAANRWRRQVARVGLAGMSVADREAVRHDAGSVIFRPGDQPDFAYIVLSGSVQVTAAGSATLYQSYQLFGDLALIDATPRRATALAAEDCVLMRIPRARFQGELLQLSPLMRSWMEGLADGADCRWSDT